MKNLIIFVASFLSSISPCHANDVEILNLKLKQNISQIDITWDCNVAEDKYIFVVDKSDNGMVFNSLDTIFATKYIDNYSCKDYSLSNGIFYYRLRCLKLNGEEIASEISYLEVDDIVSRDAFEILNVFPIPCIDKLNMTILSKNVDNVTIQCHNLKGELLFETRHKCSKGFNTFCISDFVDGINYSYYLTISNSYLFNKTIHVIANGED